jgi:hypothetical protein
MQPGGAKSARENVPSSAGMPGELPDFTCMTGLQLDGKEKIHQK